MESKSVKNKFIPRIYSYCDRWCERCSQTEKCSVYADGQKKTEEHRQKGEDPDNWEIVVQDMQEDIKKTMCLLHKAAKEEGMDLNDLSADAEDIPDPRNHPLCQKAGGYMSLVHNFLKQVRRKFDEKREAILEKSKVLLSYEEDEVKVLEDMVFHYETLSWYHTLIPTKVYRALSSKMEGEQESDPELVRISFDDANGSAKVVYSGLLRSIVALQRIYTWDEELKNDALTLLVEADRLRKGIDAELPGHKSFKSPWFCGREVVT
ncbi:MAG: hypothetical protein NT099_01470 [Candidatus Saganbacteria bacterium]|nr:hypothetical protein [Candidatus Saganbacteria bacterium]